MFINLFVAFVIHKITITMIATVIIIIMIKTVFTGVTRTVLGTAIVDFLKVKFMERDLNGCYSTINYFTKVWEMSIIMIKV